MSSTNKNKLVSATYLEDVKCELRLAPSPKDELRQPMVGWISEKLLDRLRHLAWAYELPLLGRLPTNGSTTYPEVQLAPIEEELAFLFEVVSDNALLEALTPLREMIKTAEHDSRGWSLIVETN